MNMLDQMITTTELCEQVGYKLSVAKIKSLGFEPLVDSPRATYWSIHVPNGICLLMARDLIQTSLRLQNKATARRSAA